MVPRCRSQRLPSRSPWRKRRSRRKQCRTCGGRPARAAGLKKWWGLQRRCLPRPLAPTGAVVRSRAAARTQVPTDSFCAVAGRRRAILVASGMRSRLDGSRRHSRTVRSITMAPGSSPCSRRCASVRVSMSRAPRLMAPLSTPPRARPASPVSEAASPRRNEGACCARPPRRNDQGVAQWSRRNGLFWSMPQPAMHLRPLGAVGKNAHFC